MSPHLAQGKHTYKQGFCLSVFAGSVKLWILIKRTPQIKVRNVSTITQACEPIILTLKHVDLLFAIISLSYTTKLFAKFNIV